MKNRPEFSPINDGRDFHVSQTRAENFLFDVYGRRREHPELDDYLDLIKGDDAEFQKAKFRSRWKKDEGRAKVIRESHDKTAGKAGLALENFLAVEVENSDWFNASVFATCDIDDYTKGVDAVLEWDSDDEGVPYRMAVDFTSAVSPDVVNHKLNRSRGGASVDYYISDFDDENPIQELNHLPRVVLGIDASLLQEVARAGLDNKKKKLIPHPDKNVVGDIEVDDVDKRAYADHPLKIILLEQAKLQLGLLVREESARIARRLNKYRSELSEEVDELLLGFADAKKDPESAIDFLDSIFATDDDILGATFKDYEYLRWNNWSGCYWMVSDQLAKSLEDKKTRPEDVQVYKDRSMLNVLIRENVEARARKAG